MTRGLAIALLCILALLALVAIALCHHIPIYTA